MTQNDAYKYVNEVNYISDLVGADLPRDLLNVGIRSAETALDVTAQPVPTEPESSDFESFSKVVKEGEKEGFTVSAPGSSMLFGSVSRMESYSVVVQWQDQNGETRGSTNVLGPGSGSRQFRVPMQTPFARVRVADEDGRVGEVTGTLHTTLASVDGATEETMSALADALSTRGEDSLLVQQQSPLDVSGATVTVDQESAFDIGDRDERVLGDVDVTTLPDTDEASGIRVEVPNSESIALATLSGQGANRLVGQVRSNGSYDVAVEWLGSPGGKVVRTESVASGVAGETWTDIDLPARSPYCSLVVTDQSGADRLANFTVHMT